MIPSPFTKLTLIFSALFGLLIIGLVSVSSIVDERTKIVFCNVGQGDATYIRIKNRVDLLIDAGPDRKVLSCLGKYMPFYDRKIELAIISHPQNDHFGGFLSLVERYQIKQLIVSPIDNSSQSFTRLKQTITNKKIPVWFAGSGERFSISGVRLSFYWPSDGYLKKYLVYDRPRKIGDQVLGASSLDANYFSSIFMFQENNFRLLFTGDAPSLVLNLLTEKDKLKTTILKIPHHGSKNGLNKKFLQLADPETAVITVGKNNPHGHPAKETLEMLQALKIQIRRTDEEGDIIFRIP